VGTSWLAVLLVTMHYVFIFDPAQDPFDDAEEGQHRTRVSDWKPNFVDVVTIARLQRLRKMIPKDRRLGEDNRESTILTQVELVWAILLVQSNHRSNSLFAPFRKY
jgi:hypothetical protein